MAHVFKHPPQKNVSNGCQKGGNVRRVHKSNTIEQHEGDDEVKGDVHYYGYMSIAIEKEVEFVKDPIRKAKE